VTTAAMLNFVRSLRVARLKMYDKVSVHHVQEPVSRVHA
jgi:hypothetical protein